MRAHDGFKAVLHVEGEWYAVGGVSDPPGSTEPGAVAAVWVGIPAIDADQRPDPIKAFRAETPIEAVGQALAWCYLRARLGPGVVS